MHKGFLQTAALIGMLSVIIGAFAAHALKKQVSVQALATFETGVRYQFYHVFALLACGILFKEFAGSTMIWSGRFFIVGTILFSGSLYLLTFIQSSENSQWKWIGAITPFGGLCFITGWILLFIAIMRKA
jgi:uncharacterized membrane protein YgdD (TMEM256/DUF423 family)